MSSCLTNLYHGEPYVKSDVRQVPLLDNCYIFDIKNGYRFISSRTATPDKNIGYGLFDIMTEDCIREVTEHILSYTDEPLFVKTVHGTAMVISPLTNSCSLGILIYATFGTDHLYKYARINGYRVSATAEISEGRRMRIGKRYMKVEGDCELLLERLGDAFGNISNDPFVSGDITHIIEKRLYALSYYAACPVGIICPAPLLTVDDFDLSYFTTVVLLCMIISRDFCQKHGISVILESDQKEVTVKIALAMGTKELLDTHAFNRLRDISRERNISLDYYHDDYLTHIKFAPYAFDLSINGLKSPGHTDDEDDIISIESNRFALNL